jgi:hypothetical protein
MPRTKSDPDATRIISHLLSLQIDPTLLYYFQLPTNILESVEIKELKALEHICRAESINTSELKRSFFETLEQKMSERGVGSISPKEFIVSELKAQALERYATKREKWGIHVPFFFQTYAPGQRGMRESFFFITRTWQDGVLMLLDILRQENYSLIKNSTPTTHGVIGAIEHVVSDNTLFYALFDCEQMRSIYGERVPESELRARMEAFPSVLMKNLITYNVIDLDQTVSFDVKERSRVVAKTKAGKSETDLKMSMHFVSSIIGTKEMHLDAMTIALQKHEPWLTETKQTVRNSGALPDESLETGKATDELILYPFDLSAPPGKGNGYTTILSRKKQNEPFPEPKHTERFCMGEQEPRVQIGIKPPFDLTNPEVSNAERASILGRFCYTIPRLDMAFYSNSIIGGRDAREDTKVFYLFYFILFVFPRGVEPLKNTP